MLFVSLFVLACSPVNVLRGYMKDSPSVSNDFLKTEILVGGSVPADGSSQMLVAVHLKNSNTSPVSDYQPSFSLDNNAGIVSNICSTSDINGISACILKSTVPGPKTLTLINAKVGLSQLIQFTAPAGTDRLELLSGSSSASTTVQGSKVHFNLGASTSGSKISTTDGYSVKMHMQGYVQ